MGDAGIDSALIYAAQKTGRLAPPSKLEMRSSSRKTDLRQGSQNQYPVPATQHTRDLVPVPFRQPLDGHFGIIASPVWFRLCRVRRREAGTQAKNGTAMPRTLPGGESS